MKRFIRYLYEYEQGKRMRNVGFVKVEKDDEQCMVHIHGKGFHMGDQGSLKIYLIFEEDGECAGVWQGEEDHIDPAINRSFVYTKENVGAPGNFEKINGVVLEDQSGRRYGAVWDDSPADISKMKPWTSGEQAEEAGTADLADSIEIMPFLQSESVSFPGNSPEENSRSKIPWKARKIQRAELSRLARCEWRLANNKFLTHGYYNYHHLALLESSEQTLLGVPGIYHEKEERAAAAFGFTEFIAKEEAGVDLNPEECNEDEPFGYWCRPVKTISGWQ